MHYIRLLRPARFDATTRDISLLLTITTDLGDSFLHPDAPVDLAVTVDSPAGESLIARRLRPPRWVAGLRVLDIKIPVSPHLRKELVTCTIKIHPVPQSPPLGSIRSVDALPWTADGRSPAARGLIMPATVEMVKGVCSPVSLRTLQLCVGSQQQDQLLVHLEEDIGESIARHIWDAGVVTACFLADVCRAKEDICSVLPIRKDSFCVLELGSGVGILGITLAHIIQRAATMQDQTLSEAVVLLTDLPEAEERARSNIARTTQVLSEQNEDTSAVVKLQYENLDWDEGRLGKFGPFASSHAWDLVVLSDCTYNVDSLPALVETLSALHASNLAHHGSSKTSVLLATKPRHSSEEALFGLLEGDDWRYRVLRSIPLPKMGEEDEVVDIYLLEKGIEIS